MARRVNVEADTYDKTMPLRPFSGLSAPKIGAKGLTSIFGIFLLALFFVNVMRAATGNQDVFTFTRLLNAMQNAPSISLEWLSTFQRFGQVAQGDWGIFEFLKNFINGFLGFFGDIFTVVGFVGTGGVQLILYVVHFIPVLFGY